MWNPRTETLVLEIRLGSLCAKIPVEFSDEPFNPERWSAKIYPGDVHKGSVTIHICTAVLSAVAQYQLLIHIYSTHTTRRYRLGTFVLLCNPYLPDDPVYMPHEKHLQEYVKSDYGLLYMGSHLNVSSRPWSFDQYDPGVLEACLQLLQISPQHLQNPRKDYLKRADPVYLSRVICAMVNCNDDDGILQGKWSGSYKDGVRPTDWGGSADILHRWISSKFKPVRYGQCWVFASVLCTVMRVLGIPCRVVTVFNAAHDTDGNIKIKEYYSTTGEKLSLSKDSIWNFHVWAECWMRRPDLGLGLDGWQVVDPTPQEKSEGIYCCGPCPVTAVQERNFIPRYDCPFIYASVDADIERLIVRDGRVVGKTVDTEGVGKLIYTKSISSDRPENLTPTYKAKKEPEYPVMMSPAAGMPRNYSCDYTPQTQAAEMEISPDLKVSLDINEAPAVGESIAMTVTITNESSSSKDLSEHINAQLKEFNSSAKESFWKSQQKLKIKSSEVLKLNHTISPSDYESILSGEEDIVSVAVVIKDMQTGERFLAAQEFGLISPKISVEIDGGDSIQIKEECTACVSFVNTFAKALSGAVLKVEGRGLLKDKEEARLAHLQPGDKIEKRVVIMASSPGTKLLMATFSHSGSPDVMSRCFHKVSVTEND
ncbi:uncharacterized protein V6R79_015328 [Siganus canaliculatus]